MTESDGGYAPNIFHIKPNAKTRWIINATNPYTCASQVVVPSLGVTKQLEQGENVIEFISPASGTIKFSCSMGMYTGKIIIDAVVSDTPTSFVPSQSATVSTVQASGGYSCPMMSGRRTAPTPIVSQESTKTEVSGNETISAVYTANGMSPNEFKLAYGKTYTLSIDVRDTIGGCMHRIVIPGFDENVQELNAGNTAVFTINANQKGRFPLTCAMGVSHGYIDIE